MAVRAALVALLLAAVGCGHDEVRAQRDEPTVASTSTPSTTTVASTVASTTTTTAPAPDPTTTSVTQPAAWPAETYLDEALGVRLTVATSSQDVGPSEHATFRYTITNITKTEYFVYDSNNDLITLRSDTADSSWSPSCLGRPAVVVFATLAPGQTIGRDVAYPGDTAQHSCPRPAPGDYQLQVRVYGCRRATPYEQGERNTCDARWTAVRMAVRQR